jgi:hypothetical protein
VSTGFPRRNEDNHENLKLDTGRYDQDLKVFCFLLALQPQFGPWPTFMKLPVSLLFTRSYTFGRIPWASDLLVARPLPVHKDSHTQTLNIHALSGIRTHDPGFRASEGSAYLRWLGYRDRSKTVLPKLILYSSDSGQGPEEGACEHGNGPLMFHKMLGNS